MVPTRIDLDALADRHSRRRPFSAWMKKLANFKHSSSDTAQQSGGKKNIHPIKSSKKQTCSKKNNPYPASGHLNGTANTSTPNTGHLSFSTVPTGRTQSTLSMDPTGRSMRSSVEGLPSPTIGNKSIAPTVNTVNTEPDASHSDAAASHGASSGDGTTVTVGNSGRGADSTFSSPAPSVRSLTTTLTTIHSATLVNTGASSHHHSTNTQPFSHQFPTSPPTALPAHLAPQGSGGHPSTYNTATANNLLTDNASILTLASSSKRRRRRSMDTDASVRALAPSSLWGGSRESLPLSVLSANIDPGHTSTTTPAVLQPRASGANAERISIYSATGVAPALTSDRNSYYAGKQGILGDGGSVRSGLLGHGRNDSISGSISGMAPVISPLGSPRDPGGSSMGGKLSRSNSTWDVAVNEGDEDEGSK